MDASNFRPIVWILVPALGLVLHGLGAYRGGEPAGLQYDKPTELANVPVAHRPDAVAWSADGAYLAAGAWGWWSSDVKEPPPSEVYVVNVAKPSVAATLKIADTVSALAFSPDGKWLAVASSRSFSDVPDPVQLTVFDVPGWTVKFTATAGGAKNNFLDLAWAADSKALYAIDALQFGDDARVRRWNFPAFTELAALVAPKTDGKWTALAASPDGQTLAVATTAKTKDQPFDMRVVRLYDVGKGTVRSSIVAEPATFNTPRLVFTPDGKAVGLVESSKLTWWETAGGRTTKQPPDAFAAQPAAVINSGMAGFTTTPDGKVKVLGEARYPRLGPEAFDQTKNKWGAFVVVTDTVKDKNWTYRSGECNGAGEMPVVTFSPDGTKLAVPARNPKGASVLIWAVPK
jgi:WD40 repeat protein